MTEFTKSDSFDEISKMAEEIKKRIKEAPRIGIICGSGLGGIADQVKDAVVVSYESITGFPKSTVSGHSGCFVFGRLQGAPVVCMKGRIHSYEGYPSWKCGLPVRVMKVLGVQTLVVTNAAGGLCGDFKVGDIMVIKDHIGLTALSGDNPLKGMNDERWGPRFLAFNKAYSPELIQLFRQSASQLKLDSLIREGVYFMISGPCYETIAELKAIKTLGADAVGMSTVHEVIIAHHCGMKILGMSLITNKCPLEYNTPDVNHLEVLEVANKRAKDLEALVQKFIELYTSK